ncbi:hypothetical protein V6N12_060860 [Hibiscus sabdariffa]|uniref:Uncharacterized protein n=1 Tax=Hibiscus sabdariffa TaxID=183260 RepID=A0ABR2D5Q0_9ROSI
MHLGAGINLVQRAPPPPSESRIQDVGALRKPEEFYGPWMQVVNWKRRPVLDRIEKSGVLLTIMKSGLSSSRFESLFESILEEEIDTAEPAIPEASRVVVPRVNSPKMDRGSVKDQGGAQQPTGVQLASVAKVTPVETSLHKAKYSTVQVRGEDESSVFLDLPSSILRSSSKAKVKGVHGLRGSHKSGSIVKKRDERGSATSALASCVSSLVSELNQVTVPLPQSQSGMVVHDSGGNGVQWIDNMTFDQQVVDDMRD